MTAHKPAAFLTGLTAVLPPHAQGSHSQQRDDREAQIRRDALLARSMQVRCCSISGQAPGMREYFAVVSEWTLLALDSKMNALMAGCTEDIA